MYNRHDDIHLSVISLLLTVLKDETCIICVICMYENGHRFHT